MFLRNLTPTMDGEQDILTTLHTSTQLYGVTSQKAADFTITAVRTPKPHFGFSPPYFMTSHRQ